MIRSLVVATTFMFALCWAIVHFQSRFTYLNWIPDDWACVATTVRGSAAAAEDVSFRTADGQVLHGCWFDPPPADPTEEPRPVVLFFDGTAASLDSARWVIDRWSSMIGASVLVFDYRGYGKSTGVPDEQGLYCDAHAAYNWLVHEKGIDPKRIIIVGQSLGGGVALELASSVEHRLLVLESTFLSLRDAADAVFFPAPMGLFCREEFPNLARIQSYTKPVFISHGDADAIIPFSHGDRLAKAAAGPCVFWRCEGMGHADCRDDARYAAELRAFLAKHSAPFDGRTAARGEKDRRP